MKNLKIIISSLLIIIIILIVLININKGSIDCSKISFNNALTRSELNSKQEYKEFINDYSVNYKKGALDKNIPDYFFVRFQTNIAILAEKAVQNQDINELNNLFTALEYSFKHQNSDGSFKINTSAYASKSPTREDLASGTSFFLASLGSSLNTLEDSEWFNQKLEYKERIEEIKNKAKISLEDLKKEKQILIDYDKLTANRLFFNANAFYLLGKSLDDKESMEIGKLFLDKAISLQHYKGYYEEINGYDSSYHAVSMVQGFNFLISLDKNTEEYLKLSQSLKKASCWLAARIDNGEILTKGNTRVYEGGEEFLGKEKEVAVKDAYLSMLLSYYFSNNEKYLDIAKEIKAYYTKNS